MSYEKPKSVPNMRTWTIFSARSQKKHEKSEASWPLSRSATENMYSNDWLLEKLKKEKCNEIVVIQPDNSSNKKTDSKDANALCELLWNNRKRHWPSPYRAKQSRSNSETNDRNETYLRNDIYIELEGKNFSRQNTVPGRCASSLSIFTIILREHPIDKMGTYRDEK